jgi:hypothetical protein
MTAVLYDEVVTATPAPHLRAVPAPKPNAAPALKQASRRLDNQPIEGDPLVAGATRLLCIPVRQLYAALWRLGVLKVVA